MDRESYYKKFNWNKSPFIKSTSIDTPIIRRTEEYEKVVECIGGWDRIMVVTAPIGYGKTTFMNLLIKEKIHEIDYIISFDSYDPVYAVIKKILSSLPLWKRLFSREVNRSEFGKLLQKKLGSEKMLILFDEAQDYDEELFRWLRIINDRANNVFMIFFGLPTLENKITSESSFRDRKSKSIKLNPLDLDVMGKIIRERIKWVGGEGIKPFNEGGLKRVCESANSIPRKLLENGQLVIREAAIREKISIDETFVEGVLGCFEEPVRDYVEPYEVPKTIEKESSIVDFLSDLSPMQRSIVELLQVNEELSISELSEELASDIRSVGSLIRKLRGLDKDELLRKPNVPYPIVVRKGKDKRSGRVQYVYGLSDNVRRLIAKR